MPREGKSNGFPLEQASTATEAQEEFRKLLVERSEHRLRHINGRFAIRAMAAPRPATSSNVVNPMSGKSKSADNAAQEM